MGWAIFWNGELCHGLKTGFFCYSLKINFICYPNRFFTYDYSLWDGGDIRFCGQKQTLIIYCYITYKIYTIIDLFCENRFLRAIACRKAKYEMCDAIGSPFQAKYIKDSMFIEDLSRWHRAVCDVNKASHYYT